MHLLLIASTFASASLCLSQHKSGYGSIFEDTMLQLTTPTSVASLDPPNVVTTTSSNSELPAMNATAGVFPITTPALSSFYPVPSSSGLPTQLFATIEIQIGNLSGSGIIEVSSIASSTETRTTNFSTSTILPTACNNQTVYPSSSYTTTLTYTAETPPYPANSTLGYNRTIGPTGTPPLILASPSYLGAFSGSASLQARTTSVLLAMGLAHCVLIVFVWVLKSL